ncbi:MAG TPA: hypothetical protein DER01_21560, partial [Phycisphaerales bacterium]|nr:hypothetical protein [Phycisphaerales bacterium]
MKRIIWCQAVCLLMLLGTGHTAVAESANALVYANLADAKLHTSPGSKASINRHSAIKTPDGQNILEVICTEFQPGSTAKDIQLHVPLDERIKAGHRYELNFTCQASNTGTLSLAPSTSSPDFETKIYKGWQTVKLIFTASAEGSNNLSIKLGKLGVPTTLHLGSIAYRQLVQSPQLQNQWSVFLHATTPSSLAKIPDQLDSPNGKVQRINAPLINQALDLGQLAGSVKERNTAILFNSFQSDQAGTMRLGVSADWWMELYVNGKKEFDTMDRGNGTNRYIPDDHVVNFPVKAGENVLAVKVLSGSAGWRFVCGEPSVGISTTPLNLQAGISKAIDQQTIAGATMIAVGKDQIISNESYGYADLQTKQPLQSDALFWIASMSKPITGFAFMMLVDEGKVSLDDPVSKYIPQMNHLWVVKEKDDATMSLTRQKTPITLRHLLSHTSGLPFLSPLQWHDLSGLSLENAVISFTMNPLQFEPGTKYSYSNQGIDTVGRVIEIVSGMSYEAFLQTRIFDPLGMKDTTFFPTKEQ